MTVPSSPADMAFAQPVAPHPSSYSTNPSVPPPADSVAFPLEWIMEHASPAVQYRSASEVAKLPASTIQDLSWLPYSHKPALKLAVMQSPDGTWNGSMLAVPGRNVYDFSAVGTIPAVRRLLESGWDRESPPVALARRVLFRILAEDDDPAFMFELASKAKDPESAKRARQQLREAAAAALAQAGYESDPRLRGAARRILERTHAFLSSPLGEKPWIRIANAHALAPEAAPPSFHSLTMLAHMPIFRQEHYTETEAIYEHLTRPMPRQEAVQYLGKKMVPQPQLVLGDMLPHRNAVESDIPFALMWLETMARLNFLRRNENWSKMFDRFVDDRNRQGIWHPHKGMETPSSTNPRVWPMFPLEDTTGAERGADVRWTDVTFRIGLIAKLSGREIELI